MNETGYRLRYEIHGWIGRLLLLDPEGRVVASADVGLASGHRSLDWSGDQAEFNAAALGQIRSVEVVPPPEEEALDRLASVGAGVLLTGFAPRAAEKIGLAGLTIQGSIDANGDELQPLDEQMLRDRLPGWVSDTGVQALAASGVNSPMNAAHERRAAEVAREITGLPVVEGRFLSGSSAVKRAVAAGRTAAWILAVRCLLAPLRSQLARMDIAAPVLLRGQTAARPAIQAAGGAALLGADRICWPDASHRISARITRVSRDVYGCHCDDGRFEFESLTAAKTFAEVHLRERLSSFAGEGEATEGNVRIEFQDRFGRARGKKGSMRVYLETQVNAWVEAC